MPASAQAGVIRLWHGALRRLFAATMMPSPRRSPHSISVATITQPPAPFHTIARGRAGASLLAMILYTKYGRHQPLNRQRESFTRERIELDVSTMADGVGVCTASLAPLVELIRSDVRPDCTGTTLRCRCWPKARR